MAMAATNNAERMVHFLVSKFRVGSGVYENRVLFDGFLDLGQNLRVMVRIAGQIVKRTKKSSHRHFVNRRRKSEN